MQYLPMFAVLVFLLTSGALFTEPAESTPLPEKAADCFRRQLDVPCCDVHLNAFMLLCVDGWFYWVCEPDYIENGLANIRVPSGSGWDKETFDGLEHTSSFCRAYPLVGCGTLSEQCEHEEFWIFNNCQSYAEDPDIPENCG